MTDEKSKKYIIEPIFEHFNENNELKPYGYQHMINTLSNVHLKDTNQGIGTLLEGRYFWVLVSMSFEIHKQITEAKEFIGKTWYPGRKGPYYRREYVITDNEGNIYLKGASYSVLMDFEDRSVYRKKELPFKSFTETNEFVVNFEPRFKEKYDFINISEERKVLNSYFDPIGHVNNLRYTEFLYDAFTDKEIKNIKNLKRFDVYFENELTKGDTFIVNKNITGNKTVYEIVNTQSNKKAFSSVFTFTKA